MSAALAIAIPTRNRSALLERAISSVLNACRAVSDNVEISVSDGSTDEQSRRVVETLLAGWSGGHRYVKNDPPLSQVANMNRAIDLTSAPWVLQLHDDDYLLRGAGAAILDAMAHVEAWERVLLFGVDIVDFDGVRRRSQTFRQERYMEPGMALHALLSRSSFVRQPAIVVRRSAFDDEGLYDPSVTELCDTEMYVRLFSRYGVRCIPRTTCAYTIHVAAATTQLWNPETIGVLDEIFDRAVARSVVPEPSIRRWQADFLHQFILAGAYRRLRLRQRAEARRTLRLFDMPEVQRRGISLKWLPVRIAFTLACLGAPR